MKLTIEAYWNPEGFLNGQRGCYVARIKEHPGIHDAGNTREEAIRNLLRTAHAHELDGKRLSGNRSDYEVEYLMKRP